MLDHVDGDGGSGISYFTFSQTGGLVYISGVRDTVLEPVWVDKRGTVEPLPLRKDFYRSPRLSPNGTRLALVGAIEQEPAIRRKISAICQKAGRKQLGRLGWIAQIQGDKGPRALSAHPVKKEFRGIGRNIDWK